MEQEREEIEERPRKKRKKKKSKIGYYLYAVVVLLLAVAIIVVSTLILFHVQKIDVKGTQYSEKNEVLEWVRKDKYTSNALYALWKFNSGSYKIPPYLEKVEVGLSAPWALKVKVTEKKMIGCIVSDNEYIYFDKEGLVLLKSAEKMDGIPMIEGLEEIKKNNLEPDRIVWEDNSMELYFENVCVRLGRSRFDEKVVQLSPILEKLEGKTGVLDMEYYNEASSNISFKEEVTQNE